MKLLEHFWTCRPSEPTQGCRLQRHIRMDCQGSWRVCDTGCRVMDSTIREGRRAPHEPPRMQIRAPAEIPRLLHLGRRSHQLTVRPCTIEETLRKQNFASAGENKIKINRKIQKTQLRSMKMHRRHALPAARACHRRTKDAGIKPVSQSLRLKPFPELLSSKVIPMLRAAAATWARWHDPP